MTEAGGACFVANGSCLPRKSGVDDRPLQTQDAVMFKSPSSLERTFEVPHRGEGK